jgi:hypothetical protein
MTAIRRTTRVSSLPELNSKLRQAFEEYFQARRLGDLIHEIVLSCETVTDRTDLGRIATWLSGSPDTTDVLGLILTGQHLLWARIGEKSGTVVAGAALRNIRAKMYSDRFSKEQGLEISGYIGDAGERVTGRLALGPEPAAKQFVDAVIAAVKKANPPPKDRIIPWLKLFSR